MKKAAAIFLAAFYLLLTTGSFVCVVHCAVGDIFAKPAEMQMTGMHQHCMTGKCCGCCKTHSNFVVKENVRPGSYTVAMAQTAFVLPPVQLPSFLLPELPAHDIATDEINNAPPGKTGRLISLRHRSLLI